MSVQKIAAWITSVGGAIAIIAAGLAWAWQMHNEFLMQMISPLLRASYAQRINTYRKLECTNQLTPVTQQAFEDALQDYEELVGRPIGNRDCDSL